MEKSIKDQINCFLKERLPKPTSIVVGVSWWPDSILLAYYIQQYYASKWRKASLINIAHYNHGQRKESKKELAILQKQFEYNTFYWNTNTPPPWQNETKLREKRHEFFATVCKKSKSRALFLWHNLTDRIETSIMNMVRWAWVSGIMGMKKTQDKKAYTIYRPLLDIDKPTIQLICEKKRLTYFIDPTNAEPFTPRNKIRNTIMPQITKLHPWWYNNWCKSRSCIYSALSKEENTAQSQRKAMSPHPLWKATWRYTAATDAITDDMIFSLFKDKYYATQKTLTSIRGFISEWTGYFYVWWWYLFLTWNHIHCIDGWKDFWKKKHSQKKKLSTHWKIMFNGYTYDIKKDRLGWTIRYPADNDSFKKKRLLKVMLNKKIPVFARNTTPVIVLNGKIETILY